MFHCNFAENGDSDTESERRIMRDRSKASYVSIRGELSFVSFFKDLIFLFLL